MRPTKGIGICLPVYGVLFASSNYLTTPPPPFILVLGCAGLPRISWLIFLHEASSGGVGGWL